MGRITETVQNVLRTGLAPTYYTVGTGGSAFANTGREILHIKNAGGGSITLTVQTPGTQDSLAVADRTITITTAANGWFVGPFPVGVYNQSDGAVYLDYSGVASVTLAVLRA